MYFNNIVGMIIDNDYNINGDNDSSDNGILLEIVAEMIKTLQCYIKFAEKIYLLKVVFFYFLNII